jgi:hypothetical protein
LYQPGNSTANLQAVIDSRILIAPPMSADQQATNWFDRIAMVELMIPESQPDLRWEEEVENWLEHLKDDNKRYKRALSVLPSVKRDYMDLSERVFNKIELHVKTDEVLMKTEDGFMQLKPRPIAAVDPVAAVAVGPEVYAATQRLKKLWSWDSEEAMLPIERAGIKYRIVFASACTAHQLSAVYRATVMTRMMVTILVAGDDSLAGACDNNGRVMVYTADGAMFDQSQSEGPLRLQNLILERLGVTEQTSTRLMQLDHAKLVARSRSGDNVKINRDRHPFLSTGSPKTTVGNSVSNAFAWLGTLFDIGEAIFDPNVSVEYLSASFGWSGFEMKVRRYDTVYGPEFLKGMFLETTHGDPYWAPLPSRILKIGKCLTHFEATVDVRHRPKATRYEEAALEFLAQQAIALSSFAEVPILRAFLVKYMGQTRNLRLRAALDPEAKWKVQPDLFPPPEMNYLRNVDIICERYDLSPQDVHRVEEMILSAPNFAFLEDPVFLRMALVDYS